MFLEMPIALDQAWFYQINIYGWGRMVHLKRTYFHHVLSKIISQRGWFSFQTNVSVNKMHLTSGYHIQGWMGSTARFPGWLQGSAFPFAKDDFPFEVQCQPGIDETSSGWLDKFWLQWLQSSGKLIYYLSNTVVLYCVCFGVDWASWQIANNWDSYQKWINHPFLKEIHIRSFAAKTRSKPDDAICRSVLP